MLTIKLHHRFQDVWTLGRFRISATAGRPADRLGLPEDLRAVLAMAPEIRTAAQKKTLLAYFRVMDGELRVADRRPERGPGPAADRPELTGAAAPGSSWPASRSRPTRRW